MRRNILLGTVMVGLIALAASAQGAIVVGDVIKLDFSTAGDGDGGSLADWNQTTNAVTAIPAGSVVRHGDGAIVSGLAITFSGGGGGFNNDGAAGNWPGTAADPYYVLAADDIYFGPGPVTTTFSGLDTSLAYDVRISCLIGNNAGATDTFTATNGAGTASTSTLRGARWAAPTLEAGGSVFSDLAPDGSGNLNVTVANTAGGGGYYPLNAIVLEAVPPPPPVNDTLWSVDIQGNGSTLFGQSNPALLMNGVEPNYGRGQVWNPFDVPGHNLPAQNDPSVALLDSEGNATGVTLTIHGPTAGWGGTGGSGGQLDLVRDYLFVDAGNVAGDLNADWTLSGLDPNHIYELHAYGGVVRDMLFAVDTNGDGSLLDEFAQLVNANGLLFGPITPDAQGNIIGTMANGTGDAEGNWSGFQLRDITPLNDVIPEPCTLALLGLGGLALLRRRRRS